MEIRDISKLFNRTQPSQGPARPTGADAESSARGAQESADGLQLSDLGRLLAELRKAAEAVPEVRSERVQELRQAIRSGELVANPDAIAEALVRQGILDDLLGR